MAKIFVIAGHGAGDPGACGNGYTEAERVRALASRIKALGGSNVTVGDTSRNWYRDNGISSLNISKDTQIIELHMDANNSSSARGGHVIIKAGFEPDAYDNALANMINSILPGRSMLIARRSDLANPNRAAAKGYPYRLIECGFITNATDVSIFNSRMDDIARGILESFNVKASSSGASSSGGSTSASTPSTSGGSGYSGNSIVDYLNSIGQDSSFANRKKLAAQYGINNYTGTADQNLTLLNKLRSGSGASSSGGSTSTGSGYSGNSIVDYLNSVGKNSSFSARKGYAAQYGISNYTGTAEQNLKLLNLMRGGSAGSSSVGTSYYPAFSSNSIVDGLKSIGVDSSFNHRAKIAAANGISGYSGTASQNSTLCSLGKQGKLKKA